MDTIPPLSLPILLDGATGSELYKRGMPAGACTEQWVLGHPEALLELQRGYVAAGSQVLIAPTFGANRVRLEQHGIFGQVADYNRRLVELSRQAAGGRALVAGDMAPTGLFIAPFGESSFEELVAIYTEQAAALAAAGVRIFGGCCGTTAEHVAALRAAVEAVDFSAFVPPRRDPDVIPCASEKEARFITPDIDVGETIECTSDLLEDILEAEENAPQGALKIAIYDEDDLYTFAENQYAVKDALCLWTDVPELLEQALRLYQGRAFWDGTGELEAAFLQEMARKYGLVLL